MQLINSFFKIKYIIISLFFAYSLTAADLSSIAQNGEDSGSILSQDKDDQNVQNIDNIDYNTALIDTLDPKKGQELIPFSFEEENLITIINQLAEKLNINIVLPEKADAINQKVTFKPEDSNKVTVQEAWNLLITFLELSGYTLSTKSNFYVIVKKFNDKIARNDYPLYVGISPDQLPNTDQRIQYVYFFKNLSVPEIYNANNQEDPVSQILKEVLSPFGKVIYDSKSNGVIIIDKSNNISSAMRIIREFDESGFQEVAEVIPLYYSTASNVSQILQSLIKISNNDSQNTFIGNNLKAETSILFPTGTKVIADPRTNSLILLGRESAVTRIKDFVSKNIDISQDKGESVLHVYDLQYLDSKQFAPVLQRVLLGQLEKGQSIGGAELAEPERYFQSPIVAAEIADFDSAVAQASMEGLRKISTKGGVGEGGRGLVGKIYRGGNRLIIAATHEDWILIENLIKELDKAEAQVILEVLIIDVRTFYNRSIAGTIRSRRGNCFVPNNDNVEFLSSNIVPIRSLLCRAQVDCARIDSLAVDLLNLAGFSSDVPSVASQLSRGSTLISFSDPNIGGVNALLSVFNAFTETKILNHPYLVTTNNKPAQVAFEETRRTFGNPRPNESGAVITPVINVTADRLVQFLPRISSLDRLNLQIRIDINEFVGASLTRNIRTVETNTNMSSGQVLIIGGLDRHDNADSSSGTPILSSIPILGQFFRANRQIDEHQNILILISPTIVQSKLRKGLNLYTIDKLRSSNKDFDNGALFGNMRDPITRFFFNTDNNSNKVIKKYLENSENIPEFDQLLTKKEQINEGLIPSDVKPPIILQETPPEQQIRKIKDLLAYEDNPLSKQDLHDIIT